MARQPSDRSAYDLVEIHWPGISIALFLATLLFDYSRAWIWPWRTAVVVFSLCLAGVLAALLGLRDSRRRLMTIIGLLLNGAVCFMMLALYLIYRAY